MVLVMISGIFALSFSFNTPETLLETFNADSIDFSTTYSYSGGDNDGLLYWGSQSSTLNLDMLGSDVIQQVGEELYIYGKNTAGQTITNGQAVYITGSSGIVETFDIASASNHFEATSVIGIATETIANNGLGYITLFGNVGGVDTSAFNEGDSLYLGENGELQNTEPIKPSTGVRVGYVVTKHPTAGIIAVHPVHIHDYLEHSSNVEEAGLTTGSLLTYNTTTLMWENSYSIFNLQYPSLAGVGNAYACIDSTGTIYRSATVCV